MTPDEFKTWRKRLGFSQAEAADALGISRATIANYERGQRYDTERVVEIPLSVAQACDGIAISMAAERGDPSLLSDAARERVMRIAAALKASRGKA